LKNQVLISLRGGKTQLEIAKKLGISVKAYSAIETGKRFPRIETLKKLSDLYGKSVNDLFFYQ
jgi:putative transcriptional regulator